MKQQRILFTGITGLLGKYFVDSPNKKYEIFGVAHTHTLLENKHVHTINADITDKNEIGAVIEKIRPKVVVHAASIGNVDFCETNKDIARKVNIDGTKFVLEACKKINAKILFTSTNAVYDGEKSPYTEESRLLPVDVYGQTKVEAEKIIQNSGSPFCIVRLMTMYGWPYSFGRKNPVTWVIDQLKVNKNIYVVNDIYNNHLWAGQAAQALWNIIDKDTENQVYNIAGGECISRYELALKVASMFDLNKALISPVPSSYFKNVARRPKNTCFDTSKISKRFNMKLYSIEEGLREMKREKI